MITIGSIVINDSVSVEQLREIMAYLERDFTDKRVTPYSNRDTVVLRYAHYGVYQFEYEFHVDYDKVKVVNIYVLSTLREGKLK